MTPRETYTHGHHDSVLRSHRSRTAANSAAYLLPYLQRGQSILDIGCGPGTITVDLAATVAPGRTIGVDQAKSVVDAARAFASEQNSPAEFATGDAYALDFDDNTFDVVHAHQVLQHLGDPTAALKEWARVTKPGGIVAARDADYQAMFWYPLDPLMDDWLSLYRDVARANNAEPDAGRRLPTWGSDAGFTQITTTAAVWCYSTPDEREWWADLWADQITISALNTQLITSGLATHEKLQEIATAFRAWAQRDNAFFVVPHGEIVCKVALRPE